MQLDVALTMNTSIQKIFSQIPKSYERINHLLTFGLDILWRKKAVRIAMKKGGLRWLDVCTGTGETAIYLSQKASLNTRIFGVDFTRPMLMEAVRKPESARVYFSQADVKELPFPNQSFDLITISFATRNLNLNRKVLVRTFSEFHRVLKPDAWFVNLETSQPGNKIVRTFYQLFVRLFVQQIGTKLSGSRAGYAYLANTIPRFYSAEQLSEILMKSGFRSVKIKKILFGVVAIHVGSK